jgi:hypothetical protein
MTGVFYHVMPLDYDLLPHGGVYYSVMLQNMMSRDRVLFSPYAPEDNLISVRWNFCYFVMIGNMRLTLEPLWRTLFLS